MKKVVVGIFITVISIIFISYNIHNKNFNYPVNNINQNVIANSQKSINQNKITINQAKEIALKHANLLENQVVFIKSEQEFDDGIEKYEIEFYFDNKEYDYNINANTGNIISFDYE